ncbi:alpha/beta hydrolase fold protein [Xylanimonas cellulosilytica DSM 15894]|uniref:Alpha/beta hydrolase fold protein n=1 Tax=Xylanimonas cellulosilytica (strain DSM 15894 / JCM 12276 / CECT 5975 / KCTC 9989 / LMG 20990 / NBRC 107835 / XIL07) TaxID=446471 RepID=D1BZR4_XYLCX|nr:alpha/beta hydrolase [Xylanimonas cellulosilytica]ACZ32042.1 alpha/beta hydrolase fold protein [Xylanimonas cellulosilytica DSM 15894]
MAGSSAVADYSAALVEGPWKHEFVPANGARFHVALAGPERGSAPLVVLLHGFGQFWWTFRDQITALADAGYRVAAMDLRGTAASDKPPSGYDTPTRTRDVAGVVRSLGHDRAVVVGHGFGGAVAWSMASLQPAITAGVAALACPHPARVHAPLVQQLTPQALRLIAFAQLPTLPERRLRETDLLERVFALGAAQPLPADAVALYKTVLRIPFAAHTAAEALRWNVRSTSPRPDGRRFTAAVRRVVTLPTLQVHGALDGLVRRDRADADGAAFSRDFRFEVLDDVGHYLPEEAPERTTELLLDWLPRATAR